jgi:hypothetical protein
MSVSVDSGQTTEDDEINARKSDLPVLCLLKSETIIVTIFATYFWSIILDWFSISKKPMPYPRLLLTQQTF